MSRRFSLALLACVGCYAVAAMTSSPSPRRATANVASARNRAVLDTPSPADRSGYIVASS